MVRTQDPLIKISGSAIVQCVLIIDSVVLVILFSKQNINPLFHRLFLDHDIIFYF